MQTNGGLKGKTDLQNPILEVISSDNESEDKSPINQPIKIERTMFEIHVEPVPNKK